MRFGLGYGEEKPVLFDLAAASLTDSPSLPPDFAPARVDGLPVTDWEDNYEPKFNGVKLAPRQLRSLPRPGDPAGRAPASRSEPNGSVRAYDAKGKERWNQRGPRRRLGRRFLRRRRNPRRRLWRRHDPLAALERRRRSCSPSSSSRRRRKWVAWTPTGYYMASAGGEDLIGWHVNRGWTQEADFFPASQFRAEYNRPDIVQLVLKTRDEAEAIRQANEAPSATTQATPVAAALPPVVTIRRRRDGAHFSGNSVDIAYSLRSPFGPADRSPRRARRRPNSSRGRVQDDRCSRSARPRGRHGAEEETRFP